MRHRLVLLACVVAAVAETYRRGYTAPLLYGARRWAAALNPRPLPTSEPDYLA